jgi:glycosyltransferase involved in cell wall biosynthesis
MKIFFMCTHPNQGTGYARVANKLTNYLADLPGVEVVYYAFQNYPGQDIKDRFIDPRIKFYDAIEIDSESPKGFGDKGMLPTIIKEKPDVLFLYNDLPVTTMIMDMIPPEHMPPKKYVYLDIVYPWQRLFYYDRLKQHNPDVIWVFLECWKKHLVEDLHFEESKVTVLPHGVDFERFVDVPRHEAKVKWGFDKDDYIVINMNRNSYRKQWCITIKSFLDFLREQNMNPKIKLFCGCMIKTDDGYNIQELVLVECIRRGMDPDVVLNKHIFMNIKPLHLTDDEVNMVYNMGDVGMNTCCGEGFGLTTAEHAYFNRPQIVSGVAALKETLDGIAYIVEPVIWTTVSSFESHSGDIAVFDSREFTKHLNECYKTRDKVSLDSRSHIKNNYSWENVYKVLDGYFRK